ncbi:MAG: HEAT repeat domain-containing protein [Desulfobacterales bacterium]|nr:MAG: HEAT repeat domain-containing protein [Desulfobacterales bacterium]
MDTPKQSRRDLKGNVFDLLQSNNFDQALHELLQLPARQVINPLLSFLLSSDEQIKWRAVSAIGKVVANLAERDMESARVVMRRLMWTLSDESGGIGWGAPESMGEIMASHEGLAKEYVSVLVSYVREDGNFLEYEPLQRGALWGFGRVAQVKPHIVQDAIPHLVSFLDSSDATVRGMAAWTIGLLRAPLAKEKLERLLEDDTEVPLYLNHKLERRTVSGLAKEALAAIAETKPSAI